MESIAEIEICLDDLLEIPELVFEVINSGKTGVVSPQLVKPRNVIKSVETIQKKLYFIEPPFPVELKYYILYMKISVINIMLSGERLIYVIHAPIPTGPEYEVFKFTSIPMKGWTKYYIDDFIFINISLKPIAINSDSTEYTIIDIDECIFLDIIKICEIVNPVHILMIESSSYSHLLKDKQDTNCTKKYFDLNNNFILALENGYS